MSIQPFSFNSTTYHSVDCVAAAASCAPSGRAAGRALTPVQEKHPAYVAGELIRAIAERAWGRLEAVARWLPSFPPGAAARSPLPEEAAKKVARLPSWARGGSLAPSSCPLQPIENRLCGFDVGPLPHERIAALKQQQEERAKEAHQQLLGQ